jgi:3-oxoacyl-[acyl-carrier protein] reductase
VSLAGHVVLVTGASRGIGAAVARALAAQGARLGLVSRSGGDLALTGALGLACDVRDAAGLEVAAATTVQRFGRLDALVANAGVGGYGPFLNLPLEELDEMVDVNVKGTLYAIRAALPHLGAAPSGGDVVLVGSGAGRRGLPDRAAYTATKFAQAGFAASLQHEVRARGVRCAIVAPGGTATTFAFGRGREPGMPALERMLRPEDVAEAVLFVLTRPPGVRVYELGLQSAEEPPLG